MARKHGKGGKLFVGLATSAAAAEAVAFLNNWSIDFSTDKVEVTSFGDTNKTYVSGLPDAQGQFAGFYDDATAQLYTAASDGAARRFYLYPDVAVTTQYFFGTGIFDFSISSAVDAAVSVSGSFAASTAVAKIG